MAALADEKESPVEATERREKFAQEAISTAVRQKAGKSSVHGTFTVRLHWRAGVLEQVTIEDSATYK
jgi:hypothetical protein